jgi:hypothetical protein
MQRPILGAQRRIEGRIGQLLGPPENGGRGKLSSVPDSLVSADDRVSFRYIAKALNGDCKLALLWQIYSRRCCVSIQVRQYGHRRGLDRMLRSTMACRTAGNVG